MDADKYYGKYLKAEDVKQDINVSIESVDLETIEGEEKIVVSLLGFTKRFVLNKTNKDRLKTLFGTSETDSWVKKDITLTTESAKFKGKEGPALRVKVPSTQSEADKPPAS